MTQGLNAVDQHSYDYIKGHCGWDSVTLLYGEQVPRGREHDVALTLLEPPCSGGVEIGFLYPPEEDEDIRLRIIDSTTKTWLPMCGGMSQVIGLACLTTPLQEYFHIEKSLPVTRINLLSDSGPVPVDVTCEDGHINLITTHLPHYAGYLYEDGVRPVNIKGISAMKVGYFLVFKMDDLKQACPEVEFGHRRPGPHMDLLGEIQMEYLKQERLHAPTLYSMIYDLNPEQSGQARIFTRFFKGKGILQSSPLEVQCGTGTVAVGMAMAERGELPFTGDRGEIIFEWGSQRLTHDPYGLRKSILHLELSAHKIVRAAFSHSVVELQSMGKAYLPSFGNHLF
jgi:hypothetical protein